MDFHNIDTAAFSPSSSPSQHSPRSASPSLDGISAVASSTIASLLEGYSSLSVSRLLQSLSRSFHHRVLPESLCMPVRDRDAFARHAAAIFSLFDSFRMIPVLMLPSAGHWPGNNGQSLSFGVVLRAKMMGVLKDGKGLWENECVLFVKLSADSTEVDEIQEFVDSAKAVEMASKHAPKEFGSKKRTEAGSLIHSGPGISTVASFCWLIFTILLSKLFSGPLALVVLWMHPVLEILRRSMLEALPVANVEEATLPVKQLLATL